jgi:hypothetical protein
LEIVDDQFFPWLLILVDSFAFQIGATVASVIGLLGSLMTVFFTHDRTATKLFPFCPPAASRRRGLSSVWVD